MFTPLILAAVMAAAPTAGPSAGTQKAAPTNAICPVLGNAVTPGKSPMVTVRGRQYYICCAGCDAKLLKDPDKYLDKDGRPKNAPKK